MAGRPRKITTDILAILEEAFLNAHTDQEACILANIDDSTLYRYCEKHPNFARKKEQLKQNVNLLARKNIVKRIKEGDPEYSKWWIERKARDEFKLKDDADKIIKEERERWENEKKNDDFARYVKAVLENKLGQYPPKPNQTNNSTINQQHTTQTLRPSQPLLTPQQVLNK